MSSLQIAQLRDLVLNAKSQALLEKLTDRQRDHGTTTDPTPFTFRIQSLYKVRLQHERHLLLFVRLGWRAGAARVGCSLDERSRRINGFGLGLRLRGDGHVMFSKVGLMLE